MASPSLVPLFLPLALSGSIRPRNMMNFVEGSEYCSKKKTLIFVRDQTEFVLEGFKTDMIFDQVIG